MTKKFFYVFLFIIFLPLMPLACMNYSTQKDGIKHEKIPIHSFIRFEKIKINKTLKTEEAVGFGSGFIIKNLEDGALVMTNDHVCNTSLEQFIQMIIDSETHLYYSQIRSLDNKIFKKFRVVKYDQNKDLCLLHVQGLHGTEIKIADDIPELGENIKLIGSPGGFYLPNSSIVPVISGMYIGDYEKDPLLGNKSGSMYNLIVFRGQSGSPILNDKNQLIGVLRFVTMYSNVSLGIRLKDIKEFLKQYEDQ